MNAMNAVNAFLHFKLTLLNHCFQAVYYIVRTLRICHFLHFQRSCVNTEMNAFWQKTPAGTPAPARYSAFTGLYRTRFFAFKTRSNGTRNTIKRLRNSTEAGTKRCQKKFHKAKKRSISFMRVNARNAARRPKPPECQKPRQPVLCWFRGL